MITGLVFSKLENQQTFAGILLSFVLIVASGAIEATIVGLAQWWAFHILAWLFGMPVIFWGTELAFKLPTLWQSVLVMAGTLFAAGAVVGVIHGRFLVKLAE